MHGSPDAQVIAPGKLVLLGEYAVLLGAPAVVLAVNRGVGCTVELGGTELHIHTPDGDTRFVAPALEGAPPGHYRFFTDNPVEGIEGKPGFGGSAAACVAACVAAGRLPEDALHIHHEVQGSGSGIDVLASIHGGMLRVEAGQLERLDPVLPSVIWSGSSAKTGPRVQRFHAWAAAHPTAAQAFVDQSGRPCRAPADIRAGLQRMGVPA